MPQGSITQRESNNSTKQQDKKHQEATKAQCQTLHSCHYSSHNLWTIVYFFWSLSLEISSEEMLVGLVQISLKTHQKPWLLTAFWHSVSFMILPSSRRGQTQSLLLLHFQALSRLLTVLGFTLCGHVWSRLDAWQFPLFPTGTQIPDLRDRDENRASQQVKLLSKKSRRQRLSALKTKLWWI